MFVFIAYCFVVKVDIFFIEKGIGSVNFVLLLSNLWLFVDKYFSEIHFQDKENDFRDQLITRKNKKGLLIKNSRKNKK